MACKLYLKAAIKKNIYENTQTIKLQSNAQTQGLIMKQMAIDCEVIRLDKVAIKSANSLILKNLVCRYGRYPASYVFYILMYLSLDLRVHL